MCTILYHKNPYFAIKKPPIEISYNILNYISLAFYKYYDRLIIREMIIFEIQKNTIKAKR